MNPLYNPLAILLFVVMIFLVIAIALLGYILTGLADLSIQKSKKEKSTVLDKGSQAAAMFIGFILLSVSAGAQNVTASSNSIGGLSTGVFYTMIAIVLLELLVVLVLLINIRLLVKAQRQPLTIIKRETETGTATGIERKPFISWWNRFNKFKPISEEKDIDLGHEYDGIRELNNRLPPWWIYGFYLTIVFAVVYLWRFHVSHSAPLSKEEYEISVQHAELRIKEYLKQKGESVDENTVTTLTGEDIDAGKRIFQTSCVACHNEGGAGNVGPNLTDDYWLHGSDIKSVFKSIKYGINAMPQWQNAYSNKQIAQISSYVKSLKGTKPANAKEPQGELSKD